MRLTRRTFLTGAVVAAAASLVGCAPVAAPRLRMACGEPGGTYVRFGELLRTSLVGEGIAREVEILETRGSVENLDLLRSGDAQLAISLADSVSEVDGIRAIGRVYQNYLQCLVLRDSGIETLTDLAGTSVSIGAAGSGTARSTERLLAAAGLWTGVDAVRPQDLRLADAVDALAESRIAALFWSGGVPLPAVSEIEDRVAVLDLTGTLPALGREYPGEYFRTVIPAGVYGLHTVLPAIGVPNLLLVREHESDAVVAAIVDRLIEDAHNLVPEPSVGVQFMTPTSLIDTGTVPLHPAAARRYAERYG